MHTFCKSALLLASLFLLIACSNPGTPAPTTVPPSPTALSAAAPSAPVTSKTPAPTPEEVEVDPEIRTGS